MQRANLLQKIGRRGLPDVEVFDAGLEDDSRAAEALGLRSPVVVAAGFRHGGASCIQQADREHGNDSVHVHSAPNDPLIPSAPSSATTSPVDALTIAR